MRKLFIVLLIITSFLLAAACSDSDNKDTPGPINPPEPQPFNIDDLNDTYPGIASYDFYYKWGPYNVHDPAIIKDGEYYYSYSTDASYGNVAPPGIQVRRSKDLVDWQYIGRVFSGLPAKGVSFITANGGTPFNSLWAPYVIKRGSEFRLYYSLSCSKPRLSVIGLATASSPLGPWTEKGPVVTSLSNNTIQTNAIDPTVIEDQQGKHWMYYGSAWDGIYIVELDATTGMTKKSGDKGRRIAQRGFTGNIINGNIEGPEIIYHPTFQKYYLFIAYDWLETKYNLRVGRSDSPTGPFYDFNGHDLNGEEDNIPMIIAPYQFKGHGGWQGTSHCAVFADNNQFYVAHQGRPAVSKYYMVLHVRKLFWTSDGWPVASPERYAATEQTPVAQTELAGTWERIMLNYHVVPGYAEEQTSPDLQIAVDFTLNADGTLNTGADAWTYRAPWISFRWSSGAVDSVYVERGRDWENKKTCLIFTGLNSSGTAVWGKK